MPFRTARMGVWVMALFSRHELAQLSISVALPYLAYIGAEQSVGASGVVAVVAAGLTLNLIGPGRLPPASWANLREVWDLLAHWAGALIFILAALLIPRMLEEVRLSDFALLGVVILAATAARASTSSRPSVDISIQCAPSRITGSICVDTACDTAGDGRHVIT